MSSRPHGCGPGRRPACLAVAALLVLLAHPLAAQPAQPQAGDSKRASAGAKLTEAKGLYEQGEYAAALERLREAQALFPSPKLHFDVAQVQFALAREGEALESYERFLSEGQAEDPHRDEAARQVKLLEGRVGRVTVRADRAGVISIDGRARGRAPLEAPLRVEPGEHLLVLEPIDGAPIVRRFTLTAGAVETLALSGAPVTAPARSPPATPLAGPTPAVAPAPLYRRPWFLASAGVLLGALLGGAAVALTNQGNTAPELCPTCNGGTIRVGP